MDGNEGRGRKRKGRKTPRTLCSIATARRDGRGERKEKRENGAERSNGSFGIA